MISSLRGSAVHIEPDALVIDVGGVGFSVAVPVALARTTHIGDAVHLHTALIVRDDALSLYGFSSREELSAFLLLISVTGVGPKSALGVMSALSVDQIATAIAGEDDAPFRKVSGIGPKTAKLIVLSITGKPLAPVGGGVRGVDAPPTTTAAVTAALMGLGWPERTATEAITSASAEASEADRASVSALLRLSLALLGPARPSGARS